MLFGLACILGMSIAIFWSPGIIFDSRTAVLSMAALFGGPIVGVVAAALAAAYRLWLGGEGMAIGLIIIMSTVLLGLLFRHTAQARVFEIRLGPLFVFALAVHLLAVGWFAFLPLDFGVVLRELAPPYVAILTAATVVIGLVFREIERSRHFDVILDESEERFRTLFDTAAVAIWEEDFSAVLERLRALREQGVTDLGRYLAENPTMAIELAARVRVARVNAASLALFGATSREALIAGIVRTFGPRADEVFAEELCAIWDGEARFTSEASFLTFDGHRIECLVSLPIPKNKEEARHVPVCLVDITAQKAAERELADGRRRLEEIIWGTNIGTWQWNVQTGAVVFNERWAEIVGHTLGELTPITIETWKKLTHPDDLVRSDAILKRVFAGGEQYYECEVRMRHKSGEWVWVLDRGKVTEWAADGKPLWMSGTHTEITEKKNAAQRAERLSKMRETILRCQTVLLRENDEQALLDRTVAILVEARGYALAWYGVPERNKIVRPAAWAGTAAPYLDGLTVHWSDDTEGRGPTGTAVRTGIAQVLHDAERSTTFAPWREAARRYGFKTTVAVPILASGEVFAVLSVYSTIAGSFDDDEIALLSDFASDLGLAIQALRTEAQKEKLRADLDRAALGTIDAIAATLEKRDPYTSGHQLRVAELSVAIAKELGWGEHRIEGLRLGATIHDIGKIYVPAEILNRPGKLTASEFAMIKSHTEVGADILANTNFPWPIREMVAQHHERLDGSGYPAGLKRGEIAEEAMVIGVADVVEAITSHRPYRPALGLDVALREIDQGRNILYDPTIVDACVAVIRNGTVSWIPAAA